MNVLLIDNKSAHLVKLRQLIKQSFGVCIIRQRDPRELQADDLEWCNIVIISGGQGRSVTKNPRTFARMVRAIERCEKPTIGICLGAEAIAVYFGGTLQELPVRRVGNVYIRPQSSELSLPKKGAKVYEFHRWAIAKDLPQQLISVVESKDGVEVFRHANNLIWGLQFHPEVRQSDNQGAQIFTHILGLLGFGDGATNRK